MLKRIKNYPGGIVFVILVSILLTIIVADSLSLTLHSGWFSCIDGLCRCKCYTTKETTYCECNIGDDDFDFYYCDCYCSAGGYDFCLKPKVL